MNELLKVVLSLSLSGTLLILLLFLPRSLFKERLSKRWQYYIWLVVIARLLFPFAPETNLMARLFQGIDRPTEQMEIVSPYAQQSGIANTIQADETIHGQNNLYYFLTKRFNYPISPCDAGNSLIGQRANSITQTLDNFIQSSKYFVMESTLTDFFPNLLNGIHFRRIWRDMKKNDIIRQN